MISICKEELDVCLKFEHKYKLPEYVYTALSTGQEEEISAVVPGNLIHFKFKLFINSCFMCLWINECDKIFLVADRNRTSVG